MQIQTQGRLVSILIDTEVVEMHIVALTTVAVLGIFKSSINFLIKYKSTKSITKCLTSISRFSEISRTENLKFCNMQWKCI